MVKFKNYNAKSVKDNGTYVFGDFTIGLYYLDTPRLLGEQLGSLALTGGQNIWAEKGALVPQYGYKILDKLPEGYRPIIVTKDTNTAANFFIVALNAERSPEIFLYTANQGLKKYKSTIDIQNFDNVPACHDGKNLVIYADDQLYLFGAYYSDAQNKELITEDAAYADYNTYYDFTVPNEDKIYYWNGKDIIITNDAHDYHLTVMSVIQNAANVTVRAVQALGETDTIALVGQTVDISENTVVERDLIYYPEDYDETIPDTDPAYVAPIPITPELMAPAQNRLCIVDVNGRIYYSAIGGVDYLAGGEAAFDQKFEAGFFEGFYRDSSKVLSIEDFMTGVLVCKENGIYYLTLQAPKYEISQTGSSGEGILSLSNMQVGINKIANIGQQYAGDHVIVNEAVYAFDTNSGAIVNAASVNAFGTLVSGGVIIDAAALNAYNSGISSSKRMLTWNGQESLFTLYYGEDLTNGVVLKLNATLFPRKLDIPITQFLGFNQGVVGVGDYGEIFQDFKAGTIIESLPAYADFEAIGVRDNRAITSTILEVTELNGVEYVVTTKNTGTSMQNIHPNLNIGASDLILPPLLYSDKSIGLQSDSFELTTRWADKKAHVTRIAAPMSGRDGVSISIEFPKNTAFCLAALRLPDFSLGEI